MMDFGEALAAMRDGKAVVKRSGWDRDVSITMIGGEIAYRTNSASMKQFDNLRNLTTSRSCLADEDIAATDWQIANDKAAVEALYVGHVTFVQLPDRE